MTAWHERVERCAWCPFSTEAGRDGDELRCEAWGDRHEPARMLTLAEQAAETPPDWCPLRAGPRLVQLKGRAAPAAPAWPTVMIPGEHRGSLITYVLGFVEDAVKIGTTSDLARRRRAYDTHLPIEIRLVHFLVGNHEAQLFHIARPWHIRREWFHRDCLPAVVAWRPT